MAKKGKTGKAKAAVVDDDEPTFRDELQGVYAVWYREFKVFQREKSRVVSSLVSPLMWLFLFGSGVGSTVSISGIGYQKFIYPGILTMAVLFSSVFFGLYIVWDRKLDVLKAVLVAPVSRTSIFFGKALGGCTDVMIQACILLIIAPLFGIYSIVGILGSLLFLFITCLAMVSMGLAVGTFFESLEGFQLISTFLVFPLFFLSGALYPVGDNLPEWLRYVVMMDPLTYAVDGIRGLLLDKGTFPIALDLGAISLFALLMILAGGYLFNRMK